MNIWQRSGGAEALRGSEMHPSATPVPRLAISARSRPSSELLRSPHSHGMELPQRPLANRESPSVVTHGLNKRLAQLQMGGCQNRSGTVL